MVNILGVPIAAINLDQAAAKIEEWILTGQRVYVTVTGVHGIMESQYDKEVKRIHQEAGMCVPDGMPTVWIGKLHGNRRMSRVYGPDLMLEMMKRSMENGYTNFFFGGKEGVPETLRDRFIMMFPGLKISGVYSPPFRPMNEEEENGLQDFVNKLSPDITWVGLGTPKQEKWMASHIGRMNTKVMVGVGAAFDFHAGLVRQAPRWIQKIGMEWVFRLWIEPKRLWRRYLKNNPLFILMILVEALGFRNYESDLRSR